MSKITTGTIVALVIGLLLGFGLGAYTYMGTEEEGDDDLIDLGNGATTTPVTVGADLDLTPVVVPDDNTVSVTDTQVSATDQEAGLSVIVDEAAVQSETWVAVRDWLDGGLGRVLGARRVPAGTNTAVLVDLLRATEAGKTYAVVLYQDDGDKLFDHKKDALMEINGRVISSVFDAN